MTGKQTNNLSLLAFLLASSVISGCNDDGTSIREFGTGSSSSSSLGGSSSVAPIIDLNRTSLAPGEYLLAEFAMSPTAEVSIDATLFSGQDVELYFLNESEWAQWKDTTDAGESVTGFTFGSTYPDLEGTLSSSINTGNTLVTQGFYGVLIENTDAGTIQPDETAGNSDVNMAVYVHQIDAGEPPEVRSVGITKARVLNLE